MLLSTIPTSFSALFALALVVGALTPEADSLSRSHKHARRLQQNTVAPDQPIEARKTRSNSSNGKSSKNKKFLQCRSMESVGTNWYLPTAKGLLPLLFNAKVKDADGRQAWFITDDTSKRQSLSFQQCDSEALNAKNSEHWEYGIYHLTKNPDLCMRASTSSNSPETTIVLDKCDYRDSDNPQRRQLFWRNKATQPTMHLMSGPMMRNSNGTLRPHDSYYYVNEQDVQSKPFGGSRRRVMIHRLNDTMISNSDVSRVAGGGGDGGQQHAAISFVSLPAHQGDSD